MKIAFVTDDEQTLTAHFGRAPYVVVVTVQDGKEIKREIRAKVARSGEHAHDHHHDHDHSHDKHLHHGRKFEPLQDCDVAVMRGIGSRAFQRLEEMGLQVYLTGESSLDSALAAYLAGTLVHDARRMHH